MDTLKSQRRRFRRQAQREQRRENRAERRRTIRCFWTWPFGHEYVNVGTTADQCWRCISCDTPRSYTDRDEPERSIPLTFGS